MGLATASHGRVCEGHKKTGHAWKDGSISRVLGSGSAAAAPALLLLAAPGRPPALGAGPVPAKLAARRMSLVWSFSTTTLVVTSRKVVTLALLVLGSAAVPALASASAVASQPDGRQGANRALPRGNIPGAAACVRLSELMR